MMRFASMHQQVLVFDILISYLDSSNELIVVITTLIILLLHIT